MAKYRQALPQLQHSFFMTDGGLETTLIYLDNCELPYFAAFLLFQSEEGEEALRRYFKSYAELARKHEIGLILETATWRSNPYWGGILGYSLAELEEENRKAVSLLLDVRQEYESSHTPVVISGCIGPRGDGYVAEERMSDEEAEDYHEFQIHTFAETAADMVTALTLTYADEAIGIVRAAKCMHIPVVISFTVETDGRLPSGQLLSAAIQQVDLETQFYPAYYMINCAHPQHFIAAVSTDDLWVRRIHGVRANASKLSHSELNECEELDDGDPVELSEDYSRLLGKQLTNVNIVGGCCGTDQRHVDHIVSACLPVFLRRASS
ncbi:homocysteine S-methyltransferase family protein [Vibrio fluvialis]|nr:homocysteine S-methyltransferase family protein [Vibrio fluvialis]EKO3524286.1 homocysteine S-methyltransferase family protein [Vibrio fluvialis]EKO3528802.1 homocysteine S-methyltransferase family protein [Vibrio fluvialis]EKO3546654.1 homocysteine S-methyltransferase family protein [Vibrio fluvialis]ELP3316027.1 homocysteine S-methyltransferase family protein [Vibrio fluvialis]